MPPEIILTPTEPQICALTDPEPCPVCNDRTCNRVELEQAVQPHLSKTAWDAARAAADGAKAHCDANAYNWRAVAKELARRLSEQDKVVLQLEASQLAWQAKIAQETKDLLDKRAFRLTPQDNEAVLQAAADKHWAELTDQNTSEDTGHRGPFKDHLDWHTSVAVKSVQSAVAHLGRATADEAPSDLLFGRFHAVRDAMTDCWAARDTLRLAKMMSGDARMEPALVEVACAITLMSGSPLANDIFDRLNKAKSHLQAALEALKPFVPAPAPTTEPATVAEAPKDPPVKVNPDKVFDKAYKLAFDAWFLLLGTQRLFGDMVQTTAHSYRVRLVARINRDLGKVEDKLDALRDLIRETGDVLDPDNLERVKECQGHLQILTVNLRCTAPDHTPEVHKHVSGYFDPAERALSNLRNRLDSSCPWGPKRKAKK